MKSVKYLLLLSIPFALALSNCTKDKVPVDLVSLNCPDTVSFSQKVYPIIQSNCLSCHSNSIQLGGYNLEGYQNCKNNAEAILGAIKEDGYQLMPQGGPKFADSTIQKVFCWIGQGKLDN